jgi:hypothetical protein
MNQCGTAPALARAYGPPWPMSHRLAGVDRLPQYELTDIRAKPAFAWRQPASSARCRTRTQLGVRATSRCQPHGHKAHSCSPFAARLEFLFRPGAA